LDAGHRDLQLAEFPALGPVVLRARVQSVYLLVRGIGDQRNLADRMRPSEPRPILHGLLDGVVASVSHM